MSFFDYRYFSLLKRAYKHWNKSKYDAMEGKAAFINGAIYVLFIYNLAKLFGFDPAQLSDKAKSWSVILSFGFGFIPMVVYVYGGRAGKLKKYRSKVGEGGLIMIVFYLLCLTTIFVWNMDIVRNLILGDPLPLRQPVE